jgi:hypothetical protein
MRYIIEDWTGKHIYQDEEFNSYEDVRDFILEVV